MLSATCAVLSAVYQTHQAVKKSDGSSKDVERDVLKLWTILGVCIPFQFYFEAIVAVIPFSGVIFFIPSILFPLFYIWLSVPSLHASAYLFDRLRPVVSDRILPVVHSKLVVIFCALHHFFLGNFLSVLPRKDLQDLQESVSAAEKDLRGLRPQ